MNNKSIKLYISVILIIIILTTFNVTSFAQDPFTGIAIGGFGGASGAGLFGSMAGMSGLDVGYTSDPVNDAIWNKLNSESVYFSGEKHEADPEQSPEDLYDYITVDIEDWLDAQHDFIQEFVSEYDVDDDDSGTINSYEHYYSYPLSYGTYGPSLGTAVSGGSYSVGNFSCTIGGKQRETEGYYYYTFTNDAGETTSSWTNFGADFIGSPIILNKQSSGLWFAALINGTPQRYFPIGYNITQPATNVGWSSRSLNLDVFNNWENAKVKIPHSISGLNPDWTVQEFLESINNAWANHQEGQIVIENTSQPVPPTPPPPIPDTPLGEVPFEDWVDYWGQSVITNQETGNDSLDNIDTNIQTGVDTLDSIDTNIGTTNGILGQIQSLINGISGLLNQILTAVQTLVQSIVNATETLIAGILNQIPIAFQSAWNTLKQHVSIWHYVVEWVTSISAPLTWIWGIASNTSPFLILPVYASLAGAVVLALYKKFGR